MQRFLFAAVCTAAAHNAARQTRAIATNVSTLRNPGATARRTRRSEEQSRDAVQQVLGGLSASLSKKPVFDVFHGHFETLEKNNK